MRKLTGYIGAMIIVFALMGSLIAGYALNVNGTTTVINEYENVTDVSGLYTHSEDKTYIEYNPASNYVNYSADPVTYTNIAGVSTYKEITKDFNPTIGVQRNGLTFIGWSNPERPQDPPTIIQIGTPNLYIPCCFVCDYFYIEMVNGQAQLTTNDGYYGVSSDGYQIKYRPNSNEIWVLVDGVTKSYPTPSKMLVYYTLDDFDYYQIWRNSTGTYKVYFENRNDLVTVCAGNGGNGVTVGDKFYYSNGNIETIPDFNLAFPQLDNGLYYGDVSFKITSNGVTYEPYGAFYPRYATSTRGLGIDYTVSNRVNNYLMESADIETTITTGTLTLSDVGDNNYFYVNSQGKKQLNRGYVIYNSNTDLNGVPNIPTTYPYLNLGTPALLPNGSGIYDRNNPIWNYDGFHNVKLSTVIQSFSIPQNTTTVKITTNSDSVQNFNYPLNVDIDKNLAYFSYLPDMIKDNGMVPSLNSEHNKKDYLIYDLNTNVATVYTYNGIARYSGSPDEISIFYYQSDTTHKAYNVFNSEGERYVYDFYDMYDRPAPFVTFEITQSTAGVMKYADITKGYAIRADNAGNVTWNNTYENGNIKLVFRAENVEGTYSNSLTVANNNITVNYSAGRYSVTLNSNAPVDIGTWRNIVLDIDLINSKLYVLPVRTFNSFTNVVTDNSPVIIGDLVNSAPTNYIVWGITTNSLMFNVYSTDVFMNTFGVIMVNPTLDITNYFTDLNQFYRLKMYNFATYGDTITINGETLNVIEGKVTYDDITLEMKNFNVTYADGKVTIGDNHGFVELGDITTNVISMSGNWYFLTDLERGYTAQKLIYEWDWGTFILDNTAFCVLYLGFMAVSLIVARRFCTLSITDYAVLVVSVIIALGVQVIA